MASMRSPGSSSNLWNLQTFSLWDTDGSFCHFQRHLRRFGNQRVKEVIVIDVHVQIAIYKVFPVHFLIGSPYPSSFSSSAPTVPLVGVSVQGALVSFPRLGSCGFPSLLTVILGHVDLMTLPDSSLPSLSTCPSSSRQNRSLSSLWLGFYSKPSIAVITLHYNCWWKEWMEEHVPVPYFRQAWVFVRFVFEWE